MPACTLSRAPLSCSTGRTRRSVVLASAPSHTPSHLCERPLAELAAERWPSAAAAALCARSTRRPFHAALGHGAAAAHRCGKAAQGRTARACGTRHRGRRARRAAARGLCRECCLFCLTPSFPGIWMAVCLRQSAQGTLSRCAVHEPSAALWVVSLHAASVAKRRRRAARLPREPSEHEARVLPASALAPERAAPPLQARATCFIFGSATRPGRCHQKHEQLQWRTRPI